jgi:ankyrin repeat protein
VRDSGNPGIVGVLLKAGARVNDRDASGENALHQLAWYGCPPGGVETARLLFAAGADIHAKNNAGQTPLEILQANELRDNRLLEAFQKYAASHQANGP